MTWIIARDFYVWYMIILSQRVRTIHVNNPDSFAHDQKHSNCFEVVSFCLVLFLWWSKKVFSIRGSNPWPLAHKTNALPTELRERISIGNSLTPREGVLSWLTVQIKPLQVCQWLFTCQFDEEKVLNRVTTEQNLISRILTLWCLDT